MAEQQLHGIKLLISGLSNTGKTSLLKDAKDTLVVAHDGKKFPFPIPHVHIPQFETVEELCGTITEKIEAYQEKFKQPPRAVAFDSISRILLTIEKNVLERVKNYPYGEVNKEIAYLTDYIEWLISEGISVIMISHAIYNKDTVAYELVNAGGQFGKKGGMLSEVDNASFIEVKGKKRTIHHRHPKLAARSLLDETVLPDEQPIEDYSLQGHMELLYNNVQAVDEWEL